MNFTHLKSFYTVVRLKSFTLAAQELSVSQSTISQQVRNLENRYNFPLFKRTSRLVELTAEGEMVFSYAEKIFSMENEMENAIADLNAVRMGSLKIGSTRLFAEYVIPKIFQKLRENNPDLKLQLYTGLSREILKKVIHFEYHAGINGRVSYPDNLIYKQISKQKLCFITSEDLGPRIRIDDLSNYPLILGEEGSATREYIINEFSKRKIPLNNYIESQNPSATKQMVQLGMGGALLPAYSVEEDIRKGRFRKVEVLDDLNLYIDLIYLKERKNSKALRSFISAVLDASF
jgi:DNA-binding transcriptional LysR family regulator